MKTTYLKRYIRFRTNLQGRNFIWSILAELISRFPINLNEAIALINQNWSHIELTDDYGMAYHESPEFWAKHFYWGNNSYWWKKGDTRIELEKYYVCSINTGEMINKFTVLLSYSSVKSLQSLGLIDKNEKLINWYNAKNYNYALKQHYRKLGWGNYREEG